MSGNRCQVTDVRYQLKTVLYRLSCVVRFFAGIRYLISVICFAVICYLSAVICFAWEAINLNSVTKNALLSLPGLDEGEAKAIISYRQTHNGFSTLDQLEEILSFEYVEYLKRQVHLYALPAEIWESGRTALLADLYPQRLIVDFLPLGGSASYISLPDGGNILLDTGVKEDSDELVALLEEKIVGQKFSMRFASWFGRKPRIDWVIITNPVDSRIGGLKKVLKKFQVWKVVCSPATAKDLLKNKKLSLFTLTAGEKLDLIQVESPVELRALPAYAEASSFAKASADRSPEAESEERSLCLQLKYGRVSFLFPSDITYQQQRNILASERLFKCTAARFEPGLMERFKLAISPEFFVQPGEGIKFITDGELLWTKRETTLLSESRESYREN